MFDVFYLDKKPNLFVHERKVSSIEEAQQQSRTRYFWIINYLCDYTGFDFLWEPVPWESQYLHTWPSQWQQFGGTYLGSKSAVLTDYCFHKEIIQRNADSSLFVQFAECEFDASWHPHPHDPPYVYVFGNQHWPPEIMPTVEYKVAEATERKYMSTLCAALPVTTDNWKILVDDPLDFDFSWCPDPGDPAYIYVFGNQHWEGERSATIEYHVPGATERKFVDTVTATLGTLDIFYLDRSNAMSKQRFEQLQEQYPHIQKIRYVSSVLDTIRRCAAKARTSKFWVIGSKNDYSNFDFDWHPEPWQHSMTHVFGTQWNKWSDTFLINKWEFERHARWSKNIEEFPNLNFVADQTVHAPADACDIYVINHGAGDTKYLEDKYRVVKHARYFDNYLDTLRRIIQDIDDEHIWVVSSICDYTRFDFSWQPEAWQRDMLHVFPSNEQKFGDTFYVPVKKLRESIDKLELLDWFETVNYCNDQTVERLPMSVVKHDFDTHVEALATADWTGPLALLTITDTKQKLPTVSLWRDKTKTITPLSPGASSVIVPKSAVPYIKTQLYDYPYIDKAHATGIDAPLDIVFISNGEKCAEHNLWVLESVLGDNPKNKLHLVENVNGRAAAYHAAARASTTPWFFAVFAKLEVDWYFPWDWQPDRMQQPKHYIFHAVNDVNKLQYGHQAMIAYNKHLVLSNPGVGLDFTLDSAHEVVPILSGISRYNETPWMTWRTAFREVLKLRASLPDVENEYRISQWCKQPNAEFPALVNQEWSQWGALDALEYYDEVNGDFDALKKSYEWDWLASYAMLKRKLIVDH